MTNLWANSPLYILWRTLFHLCWEFCINSQFDSLPPLFRGINIVYMLFSSKVLVWQSTCNPFPESEHEDLEASATVCSIQLCVVLSVFVHADTFVWINALCVPHYPHLLHASWADGRGWLKFTFRGEVRHINQTWKFVKVQDAQLISFLILKCKKYLYQNSQCRLCMKVDVGPVHGTSFSSRVSVI